MEKYIKAAAAIIGIGALGYVGYRVITKRPVLHIQSSVMPTTESTPQGTAAEPNEGHPQGGGLDHINKTHFEILWRRAGTDNSFERVQSLNQRCVYAKVDGKLFGVALTTNGQLIHRTCEWPLSTNCCNRDLLQEFDPVIVAGAISVLMAQTTG